MHENKADESGADRCTADSDNIRHRRDPFCSRRSRPATPLCVHTGEGSTNASRYSGSTIAENFLDTPSAAPTPAATKPLLLQNDGDAVEYDFDLDDGVSAAVLKVHAKHAVVSVKAAGGEWRTLTAKNGSPADRGVNLFDLTTADALASTDKQFTVRVSFGGQAVVLNGLIVQAEQPERPARTCSSRWAKASCASCTTSPPVQPGILPMGLFPPSICTRTNT